MHTLLTLSILTLKALVAPASTLDVVTTAGTYRGVSVSNGTERWLGIPFAQTPVGGLRFKAPVPLAEPAIGVQVADTFGDACPQPARSTLGAPISEDCLHLNIWRPRGTPADAKLPVLFYIHGGFFMIGASSDHTFDPTRIIQRSVDNGRPIMFASANYRLNSFGFLASANVPEADLNVGFQDNRAALESIQDNIEAFGGDPGKVTLWGQSAGGGAVETQLVYPSQRDLFRAVITDSSTGPFKTSPSPAVFDQEGMTYSSLLKAVDCPSGEASFQCLQGADFKTFMNASNALIKATMNDHIWEPVLAAGNFISERSSVRIANGNFSRVPIIAGSNLNDGSRFSTTTRNQNLTGAAQDDAFSKYILAASLIDTSKVTPDLLDKIHKVYPQNDTSLGAPFNTGDSLYDRSSAFYGDNAYTAPRRRLLKKAAGTQKVWGYRFDEFITGADARLGVAHGSELSFLFGPVLANESVDFANMYLDFYLNFVTDLNPGDGWEPYTAHNPMVLRLKSNDTKMIDDDFWNARLNLLNTHRFLDEFIR
ncbi:alpha/beta-hydrolase [Amylostereum chailletii]|nr:alpha/beta-hydrolase [Amylostereum chailletii]